MRHKHHFGGLSALLLLGVFAVCVLVVLLKGAEAYQRLNQRDRAAYDTRTAGQYITTKLRQADRLDCVAVARFGDGDALLLYEDTDGEQYVTRVYTYDGYLMELHSGAKDEPDPATGERLLPLAELDIERHGGLVTVRWGEEDTQTAVSVKLRSGEEAAA